MKLFFFTNSYPYGLPDNWKTLELEELSKHYHNIYVFPFSDGGSPGIKVELPANVEVYEPMLRSRSLRQAIQTLLLTVFSSLPVYFLKEFFSAKAYSKWSWTKLWFRNSYYSAAIYFHPTLRSLLKESDRQSTWYFYWGNHMALVIPLVRKKIQKIVCRVHGSDLYKEASSGYLPFQQQVLLNADLLLPCSADGKNYLEKEFGSLPTIHIARLGVMLQEKKITIKDDRPFKILSCAFLHPVKRIRLIAESLQHIDVPVHWTHIGPGEELEELKAYCRRYDNSNIHVDFKGYMKHEDIIRFYLSENFQLFVNASLSEGIPVSIMEAMSIGIPVVATDVGATSELVDESVGVLLPVSVSARDLSNAIRTFCNISIESRLTLSNKAIDRVTEIYNGKTNAKKLAEILNESEDKNGDTNQLKLPC